MSTRTSVYITKFTDEMCPSDLAGWAEFLAGKWGVSDDGGPVAAHGDTFAATEITWHYLPTTRKDDGTYDVPDCPDGHRYHAVAFGEGLGWDSDLMASCRNDDLVARLIAENRDATPEEDREDGRQSIARILAEYGDQPVEWIAFEGAHREVRIVFWTDPARCEVIEDIQ